MRFFMFFTSCASLEFHGKRAGNLAGRWRGAQQFITLTCTSLGSMLCYQLTSCSAEVEWHLMMA